MPMHSRNTILLATDQQRSVLSALNAHGPHPIAYTAYGHRPAENGLLSLLGFNGEPPDPLTGHYHLGKGYRQFNPVLMRFNNPDNLSPFGEGGLNAYAYCSGDPVNYIDPNGHNPVALIAIAGGIGSVAGAVIIIKEGKGSTESIVGGTFLGIIGLGLIVGGGGHLVNQLDKSIAQSPHRVENRKSIEQLQELMDFITLRTGKSAPPSEATIRHAAEALHSQNRFSRNAKYTTSQNSARLTPPLSSPQSRDFSTSKVSTNPNELKRPDHSTNNAIRNKQ